MASWPSHQSLKYFMLIISKFYFVSPYQLVCNDITKVSQGTVESNPNHIQFFTCPNRNDGDIKHEIIFNEKQTLEDSGMNPSLPTILIIHGFRSNVSSEMPQVLKNAFLQSNLSLNIIVVDWGPLSFPLPPEQTAWLYHLVPPNVPIVAKRLAEFILFLQKANFINKLDEIYMIGHSLGAHVAGLAGRQIYLETGSKIGRITGLDPAGPLYYPPTQEKNLMKENALFVDVIHTNSGLLGSLTNDAHVDFWPNGGCSQPNCEFSDTSSFTTLGRCSHRYSYHLYAASITKSIPSCPCKSAKFSKIMSTCDPICTHPVDLGYNCPQWARGIYFASTENLLR